MPIEQFFSHIMTRTSYIWWDDNDVPTLLDLYTLLYSYSAISLKQQSLGRHVADSLRHIIPILSQPVFLLNAACFIAEKQQTPL